MIWKACGKWVKLYSILNHWCLYNYWGITNSILNKFSFDLANNFAETQKLMQKKALYGASSRFEQLLLMWSKTNRKQWHFFFLYTLRFFVLFNNIVFELYKQIFSHFVTVLLQQVDYTNHKQMKPKPCRIVRVNR